LDFNLLIGGSAGQGIDTLGKLLEKVLQRSSYYLFTNKDYMSRIRGGHNFNQIRFGSKPIYSHKNALDAIVAFDETTVTEHLSRLKQGGKILLDESLKDEIDVPEDQVVYLPLKEGAKEVGNPKVFSVVFLGALIKALDLDLKIGKKILEKTFKEKLLEVNHKALIKGFEMDLDSWDLKKPENTDQRIMINSNEAIALGALAAGVTFYSAYPMTPSTSIMEFLAANQKKARIVVEQAEDEIAAINMAIGASYAGIRAMTGTSGGGFSLMAEALGLAGITETPLVVANVQRPGPATGFPTRTEQSDLSFILTASHGEISRMVTVMRTPEEAFYKTARAFNISERYQTLVILMNDQYLADANQTIKPFDFSKIQIDRYIAGEEDLPKGDYQRYRFTEDGISPRIIPGKIPGQTVLADSDEHDENGNITESAEVRIKMMDKRMNKMKALAEEVEEPWFIGKENPEILLVGWGSTYGTLRETVEILQEEGHSIGALSFGDLYPLPTKVLKEKVQGAKKIINVEQNYTGQFAKLIRQETGIAFDHSILKYDGRQIALEELIESVKEVL
jgi:2-oxoglutarate/2-oxoacid ferredoxin oxidoreductase subunit alpha